MQRQPIIITVHFVVVCQRLKELKQREFYRALACRRQRRRREEKREERALRSLHKHEERRPGEWWVAKDSSQSGRTRILLDSLLFKHLLTSTPLHVNVAQPYLAIVTTVTSYNSVHSFKHRKYEGSLFFFVITYFSNLQEFVNVFTALLH